MQSSLQQSPRTLPIILFTFLAWFIVIILIRLTISVPSGIHTLLHSLFVISCFASVFFFYFRHHSFSEPFSVTAIVVLTVLVSEAMFWLLLYPGQSPYAFNFVDWVLPMFFLVSTVYAVGALMQKKRKQY